jgi:RNA polymerase primary sigma factor
MSGPTFSDHPRTRRQQKIVHKWEQKHDRRGTLQACTGFGKTWTACIASKRAQEKFGETDILVIVPTQFLQEQWQESFDEWDIDGTVKVINTAVKKWWNVDLLILDEIHRYASPIFGQIFDRVDTDGILGLTATLPGDGEYDHVRQHCPVFETVGLSEAQSEGWVSDFLVYNVPVELGPQERGRYKDLNSKYHSHFSVFDHDFSLAMKCLNSDAASRSYARKTNMDFQEVKKHAVQFIRNVQERKKMLYNLTSKIEAAERLLESTERKTIVFSQSKEAANRIATRFPAEARSYHSGLTGNEQEQAIEDFRSEDDVRILSSARALDQGADLPEVTLGVVIAGTSKPLQSIQRMGRTLRKEGQRAIVVEFYATNTQDEKWLSKRQRKTPNRNIKRVSSVDDIFTNASSPDKVSIAAS